MTIIFFLVLHIAVKVLGTVSYILAYNPPAGKKNRVSFYCLQNCLFLRM